MDKIELPLLKGDERDERVIPVAVIVGVVVLIVLFAVACFSITIKNTYKLHYTEKSNLDYKVYLKENDYFAEKYLPKDKQYISSLVDYIDADFNYSFKSQEDLDLEYIYYVTAKVSIDSVDGRNIYESVDTLVDKKKFNNKNGDSFNVNQNVKINYDIYNNEARRILNNYNLTADAKLIVTLNVEVMGKHVELNSDISDREAITLTVPLSNRTIDIKMDYNLANNKDATLQYKSAAITNPVLLIISIFFALLDVAAIAGLIAFIIYNRSEKVIYKKKLNKILKDYDRYISETVITERVENMLKTTSLRIIVVKDFEGLIDIRDNLNKPILFHEEKAGEEAVFYILSENVGYIYIMKSRDFQKKKRKKNTTKNTTKKEVVKTTTKKVKK